jgi:hypothetical protein
MIVEWMQNLYEALVIIPLKQANGLDIFAYVFVVVLGCLGCLLGALIVWLIVRRMTPKKWKSRTAFWGVFATLFVWSLWGLFAPSVNFTIVSMSPDGNRRLHLENITSNMSDGWILRTRFEDVRTNRCLDKRIIRHWYNGFDDLETKLPTLDDVRVRWSKDGNSALVEFGWTCVILPEGIRLEYSYTPETMARFQIPVKQ